MYIDQKWDYPQMEVCASKLDRLYEESLTNKALMDKAMESLTRGIDAEVGKAFIAAYAEHVTSIQLFAEVLTAESRLLRSNENSMQQADAEIAAQVRSLFGI